jgi:hypothetical protein
MQLVPLSIFHDEDRLTCHSRQFYFVYVLPVWKHELQSCTLVNERSGYDGESMLKKRHVVAVTSD